MKASPGLYTTSDRIRLAILVLFALPVDYLGMLAAALVHEVLGHGVAAWLVGGAFDGFALQWDGMGEAYVAPPHNSGVAKEIIILVAGVAASCLIGFLCLMCALIVDRSRWFARMALIIVALNCLLEGPPYTFWNAYLPSKPGDIAAILELVDHPTRWRVLLLVTGATVTILSTAWLTAILLQCVEQWLSPGTNLRGARRAAVLTAITMVLAASWFIFDWDQLVPGLGALPNLVGAGTQVLVALALYPIRLAVPVQPVPDRWPWIRVIAAWLLAAGAAWATATSLGEGVSWR